MATATRTKEKIQVYRGPASRDAHDKVYRNNGRRKFVTPFVGAQVDICNAFGFDIPDGCAPKYVSKKRPSGKKRGRPAKAKVEEQKI